VHSPIRRRLFAASVIALVAAVGLAACGSSSKSGSAANSNGSKSVSLRLGYFPNITHAPALIGVANGSFASKLGPNVNLNLKTFNSGTEAVTALVAGAIDATFTGPNPAINAFQKTHGGVRIVSGAASGGAFLVVKPSITSAAQLKGKKLATPQLGNTQDVALRTWLNSNGMHETKSGGDVTIVPEDNSVTLTAFEQGTIDGAWVPEPYASRMVTEGGGKVLVNEASLWPGGKFTTTVLLVQKSFLAAHPDVVQDLISAVYDSVNLIKTNPAQAQQLANQQLEKLSGKALKPAVLTASFQHITFTTDPIASSLPTSAEHAHALGLLDSTDINGIFDLTLLNKVLTAAGQPTVQSP
jgi:NitT/TauT family transport system substrate-binding protein